MGVVRSYIQRKAAQGVPGPVLDTAGKAVLKGVDLAVEQRWERALARAAAADGETIDDRLKAVSKAFSREMVSLGAATGAAAVVPGLGTASALSMMVAEVGWFAFRATDLIMTVGAVYGRVGSSPDERRAWVLAVLAFGDEAADEFAQLVRGLDGATARHGGQVGTALIGVVEGEVATIGAMRRINATLAAKVATKYGSRRGLASLGRLLPFGVGAVVGGSANWALVRALMVQARRFFDGYHLLVVPPPPLLAPSPTPLPTAEPT